MDTEQQRTANAELARRMGWKIVEVEERYCDPTWKLVIGNSEIVNLPDYESALDKLPDYFNSPVASRELVIWMAKQEVVVKRRFVANLHPGLSDACVFANAPIDEDMILEAMAAPLPVIARAACKALGIEVEK